MAENVPGGSGVEVPSTMDIDDDSIDQLPALEVIGKLIIYSKIALFYHGT